MFEKMIEGVPDEFLGQVKIWKQEIDNEVTNSIEACKMAMVTAPTGTQKDFALWVQANFKQPMVAYLFAYKLGRDITSMVYKKGFENRENSNWTVKVDES